MERHLQDRAGGLLGLPGRRHRHHDPNPARTLSRRDPSTWDPGRYLRFGDQRTRAALDLLARVPDHAPGEVWDLGCGTGDLTRLLAERTPSARVYGLDASADMLAAAREGGGPITWVEGDIGEWEPPEPAGLVFANASLHWVPDHDLLFPRLAAALADGGVLAVQMPRNSEAPSHRVLAEVAGRERWAGRVGYRAAWKPVGDPAAYLDRLAPHCGSVDVWETVYHHVLQGDDPVAEWVKGAAGRPFIDDLTGDAEEFFAEYAEALRPHYPPRPDGSTLFPFRRLFLVAVGGCPPGS